MKEYGLFRLEILSRSLCFIPSFQPFVRVSVILSLRPLVLVSGTCESPSSFPFHAADAKRPTVPAGSLRQTGSTRPLPASRSAAYHGQFVDYHAEDIQEEVEDDEGGPGTDGEEPEENLVTRD